MSRRRLLAGGTAMAGTIALGSRAGRAASQPVLIDARMGTQQLLEAGKPITEIWGYDGRVPGPTIRVARGADVHARLINSLPEATTIHWHGIRIANAMDGVAHLTQPPVEPGQSFDYRFIVPDAGTFWYHPHVHAPMQQDRGLYGLLIVEETEPVAVDRDISLVLDDWRITDTGEIETRSLASLHDAAHAGRLGNIITTNGQWEPLIPVRTHERIRIRLCSTCNARVLKIRFEDVTCQLVAIDGQPVSPEPLADNTIVIPPSGRADIVVDILAGRGATAAITEVARDRVVLATFAVTEATPARATRIESLVQLPPNAVPQPNLTGDPLRVEIVMAGGAMGQLREAEFNGATLPLRDLARQHRMVWAINGRIFDHHTPAFQVARNRTVIATLRNDTAWPHAMHVHGHHFIVTARSKGIVRPFLHDTVLMLAREEMTIAFLADNPGHWMLHCHMLEHQAAGLSCHFTVAA